MKKVINLFKIRKINVFVYQMNSYQEFKIDQEYTINKVQINNKKDKYFIKIENEILHVSYLFKNIFLLKLLDKKGPVIGDCRTAKKHRGKSLYPYTINRIAKKVLESNYKEVFIIVNQDNKNSIKGIEKAHFKKIAGIKSYRWLWLYFKLSIKTTHK